jgi:hypothetical protein
MSLKKIFDAIFSVFRRKPAPPPSLIAVNFEKDMECLFSIISTYIENERFKITISQKKVLSDSDLLEVCNSVTAKTVTVISDDYKRVLAKYFREEEMIEFISEIVVRNVVQLGLEINRKTLS